MVDGRGDCSCNQSPSRQEKAVECGSVTEGRCRVSGVTFQCDFVLRILWTVNLHKSDNTGSGFLRSAHNVFV